MSTGTCQTTELSGTATHLFPFDKHFELARAHGLQERFVVALALIGVGNREVRDGLVEGVALAEVATDLGRLTRARVGAGQRPRTRLGVLTHDTRRVHLDEHLDLHVPELPHIKMTAQLTFRPAEEEIAGGLHEPTTSHDALAVVGVGALTRITFQDRTACLLDLEEKRIVLTRHQERDRAPRANAADSDHLDRNVKELELIQEPTPIFLEGFPVASKGLP